MYRRGLCGNNSTRYHHHRRHPSCPILPALTTVKPFHATQEASGVWCPPQQVVVLVHMYMYCQTAWCSVARCLSPGLHHFAWLFWFWNRETVSALAWPTSAPSHKQNDCSIFQVGRKLTSNCRPVPLLLNPFELHFVTRSIGRRRHHNIIFSRLALHPADPGAAGQLSGTRRGAS